MWMEVTCVVLIHERLEDVNVSEVSTPRSVYNCANP